MRSYFILFFSIVSIVLTAHPLHVSIVNMDVNSDSGTINYSIRLFYDDFQHLINSKYHTIIDLDKEKRISLKEQEYILEYINSAFIVYESESIKLMPVFLSWKVENLSIWFYFGMKFTGSSTQLIVVNTLMNEIFTDQKNLMILNDCEKEQGFEFNQRNTKQAVALHVL